MLNTRIAVFKMARRCKDSLIPENVATLLRPALSEVEWASNIFSPVIYCGVLIPSAAEESQNPSF